jgi:hypothetical protein
MSRTIRKHLDGVYVISGKIIPWKDINRNEFPYSIMIGYHYRTKLLKARDSKPWGKPPKWFKVMKRRAERSRVNNAIRSDKEYLPEFKRSDRFDWT